MSVAKIAITMEETLFEQVNRLVREQALADEGIGSEVAEWPKY